MFTFVLLGLEALADCFLVVSVGLDEYSIAPEPRLRNRRSAARIRVRNVVKTRPNARHSVDADAASCHSHKSGSHYFLALIDWRGRGEQVSFQVVGVPRKRRDLVVSSANVLGAVGVSGLSADLNSLLEVCSDISSSQLVLNVAHVKRLSTNEITSTSSLQMIDCALMILQGFVNI